MAKDRAKDVLHGQEGSYALLEVIGKGAYGTVHKGIWREIGRHVAVKRVSRTRLSPDEKKGLQAEIALFKNLNYQHIVNYIEAVDDPESPYLDIVMEYVEGGSLFNMVDSIRRSLDAGERVFEETVVADLISQVVLGLRYLHQQGVVHRDIKGANLLVTKERRVKLADFGVSSTKPADNSGPLDVAGSPYWMAPEIINLTGSTTASDIWSLGCTVIELLTGFPPYHQYADVTALFKIVSDDCPPLPPNLSADCEDFLTKCFNKNVHARATADELLSHRWLAHSAHATDPIDTSDPFAADGSPSRQTGLALEAEQSSAAVDLGKYGEDDDDDDFGDLDLQDLSLDASERASSIRSSLSFEIGHGNDTPVVLSPRPPDGSPSFDFPREERDQQSNRTDVNMGARITRSKRYVSFREDPFKDLLDDPEADRERERIRRQKEQWHVVKSYASCLGKEADIHVAACEALVEMFKQNPEQRYYLIYDPGLLPIIEVLESGGNGNARVIEAMLRVTLSLLDEEGTEESSDASAHGRRADDDGNVLSFGYPRVSNIREDLCLAGFLPVVMQYCKRDKPFTSRLLAARFLHNMLGSERVLRMFIACRGFAAYVDMLEPDIEHMGEMAQIALDGIDRLLAMENQRHKRDFCRRFARSGLLDRIVDGLSFNMERVACLQKHGRVRCGVDDGAVLLEHVTKLASLLQTFAARADSTVKGEMTTERVLHAILRQISNRLAPASAVQSILCCIRDLSRDPQTHGELQAARTIEMLVHYLCMSEGIETSSEHFIISSLHNLCIVSPSRQEMAARAGIIPYLQRYILSKDMNVRSLCIDMYSRLACAGHATRVELSKNRGVDFYVDLMVMLCVPGTVRKWNGRVVQSMAEWLEDPLEGKVVEARITAKGNRERICESLAQMRVDEVEGVLEPYLKMVTVSEKVNRVYGSSDDLVLKMVRWLERMYGFSVDGSVLARGRLLLLRTLLVHARTWGDGVLDRGIIGSLRVLLTEVVLVGEGAITVRGLATVLLHTIDSLNNYPLK